MPAPGRWADLAGELTLTWDDADIVLTSVGTAPDVDASVDPVVVVDAGTFAAAGATAYPDTIWAVGSGAADASRPSRAGWTRC